MAKNFPYFKFTVSEWMTGDIVFESLSVQGLFINICALYWQRDGKLSIEDINKRYKNPNELIELTDRFFSVNNGLIEIKFLDEQLVDAGHISKVNSENGSKGGRPKSTKTLENKPTAKRPLSDRKAKKSKEEEEEEQKEEKEKEVNKIKIEDVKLYFFENKYSESSAQKFYDYYSIANWKDSKGNKVKNWKQKAQAVWFKPENEIKQSTHPLAFVGGRDKNGMVL